MAAVTICSDFRAWENKVCHCLHIFPIYLPLSDGTGCHDLSFLNVEFKASFSILLFHLQQEAFWFLFTFCHNGGVICREGNGTPSSTLAWKIPWTEKPGRLQSMGSLRVRHDWETSLSIFTFMHWRRKWQPTPVFLPRESQGWGSLVGCRLWGHTESDTTEAT